MSDTAPRYTEAQLQAAIEGAVERERQRQRVEGFERELDTLMTKVDEHHTEVLQRFSEAEKTMNDLIVAHVGSPDHTLMQEHIIKSRGFDKVASRLGTEDWEKLPEVIEDFRVARANEKAHESGTEHESFHLLNRYHRLAIPLMFVSTVIALVALWFSAHPAKV